MIVHQLLLASEEITNPNLWNPTIVGLLTVICAIGLFCGSTYLLLATNVGGRLGFLISAAALSGFMVLLCTLWWTAGSSGIDPPHGASPSWKVVEVIEAPAASSIEAVRNVEAEGEQAGPALFIAVKPALDSALVTAVANTPEQELAEQPFAEFQSGTDFLIEFPGASSFERGGGARNMFWHYPHYAVIEFCETKPLAVPAQCDPLKDTRYAVLERDLGTLRQPVVLYWFMSVILFGLSLLGLYWWEKDERARAKAGLSSVPAPK